MIKKAQLIISLLARNHRLGLWILLLLLTAIILLFPTQLSYEYHAVQSPYIFDNLPLFGALYFIWTALLLLLLFTRGGERKSRWEGLALAAIFALVYLGFWAIIAPNRTGDGLASAGSVQYISAQGTLSPNIAYADFPGLHTLTSSICQITGMEVFDGVAVVLVFLALLLSALLYLLFSKSLKNPYLAIFGVLMVIQGTWLVSRASFFYAGYMGLIFIVAFLLLLNRREGALLGTWQDRLLAIILLMAATMTHFVSSMCFLFILLGIFLVQRISRRLASGEFAQYERGSIVGWSLIVLCLTLPLAWEVYWTVATFGNLAVLPAKLIEDLSQGQLFGWIFYVGETNLGEAIPLWANVTRWFWLVFVYGFGAILTLRSLFRIRRLSSVEKIETGGLVGIALVGIIGLFLSPGGNEAYRLLMYGTLFLVPIILRFFLSRPSQEDSVGSLNNPGEEMGISRRFAKSGKAFGGWFNGRISKYAFGLVPILFLALSFPTFLAHNNTICTDAWYSYDFSAGEYVLSTYGDSENLTIFGAGAGGDTSWVTRYFMINPSHQTDPPIQGMEMAMQSPEDVWREMDKLVTRFEDWRRPSIFLFSERIKTPYQHIFGIEPTDPHWQQLEQRLQNGSKVYDNGHVQIYAPQ